MTYEAVLKKFQWQRHLEAVYDIRNYFRHVRWPPHAVKDYYLGIYLILPKRWGWVKFAFLKPGLHQVALVCWVVPGIVEPSALYFTLFPGKAAFKRARCWWDRSLRKKVKFYKAPTWLFTFAWHSFLPMFCICFVKRENLRAGDACRVSWWMPPGQ